MKLFSRTILHGPLTRRSVVLFTAVFCVAAWSSGCSSNDRSSTNSANANASGFATAKGGTPKDAKPMGAAAPGYFTTGSVANASLRFTSPRDGEAITGTSVAPIFEISGFPIYHDAERDKGQNIHVILDNGPGQVDYDPSKPFRPDDGAFDNLKPGIHTLRAFACREWHESIKQPDDSAFDMVVFKVGAGGDTAKVNKKAPLLTYSKPEGYYRWKEDPRGVMLDFYVSDATVSINDYRIKYTLNDKPTLLTRWDPVWWPWEQVGPGIHKIVLELLNKNNKPVPFMVGGVNYNRTERTFRVLSQGEQPPPPTKGKAR
jgi:hypothetical protein